MTRRIIIIAVALLLLIIGGLLGFTFGTAAGRAVLARLSAPPPPPVTAAIAVPDRDLFFDLPLVMVTLAGPGKENHLLRIQVSVRCDTREDVSKLQTMIPRVLDVFQVYLRGVEIKDVKGRANLDHLRDELLPRVNAAIAPAKIDEILFHDIMVM